MKCSKNAAPSFGDGARNRRRADDARSSSHDQVAKRSQRPRVLGDCERPRRFRGEPMQFPNWLHPVTFIMRHYVHIVNEKEVHIPRDVPALKESAIPTIFPNLPKYMTKTLPKERKRRVGQGSSVRAKKSREDIDDSERESVQLIPHDELDIVNDERIVESEEEAQELLVYAEKLSVCCGVGNTSEFKRLDVSDCTTLSANGLFSAVCDGSVSQDEKNWAARVHRYLYLKSVDTQWRKRTRKLATKYNLTAANKQRGPVKKQVRETETIMWKERMEKKGSLGIYKASKQEIRKENFYDNNKANVVFSMIHCGSRISLDNVPFRVVKETVKSSSTTDLQKEVYEKKRVNLQGTKKKGCAATMNLKRIELYPDFQVDVPQPCGQTREGRLKADKAKELQEALDAEQQTVAKETRVYARIADCSSHQNHRFEDMEAFSQNMDKSVAERIQMLAREGITSVSDVKKCLHYYVHDVLFANKEKPDSSCRAFFPTHRDISNQIQAVLKKDRFSTVDQENARILIEKIRGEQPESSAVYRPYAAPSFVGSSDSDNVEEGVASECEDTLLFCFQTKFMRSMLKKY
ncbi:hypothetical protein HPB51_019612 [Rhipicephalus microplus]|uniref:Uncharacterized protein n=1 Tax=Rhipicephalus microplus TaxID=6941 RepID=A0A9J6DJC5_RHIMP|nr:hypothetical protein HPB51_019612 [Rhipicephalus microplus]